MSVVCCNVCQAGHYYIYTSYRGGYQFYFDDIFGLCHTPDSGRLAVETSNISPENFFPSISIG